MLALSLASRSRFARFTLVFFSLLACDVACFCFLRAFLPHLASCVVTPFSLAISLPACSQFRSLLASVFAPFSLACSLPSRSHFCSPALSLPSRPRFLFLLAPFLLAFSLPSRLHVCSFLAYVFAPFSIPSSLSSQSRFHSLLECSLAHLFGKHCIGSKKIDALKPLNFHHPYCILI